MHNSLGVLLTDARQGSHQSLGELLNACRPFLLHIAMHSMRQELRTREAPSDLVQESLLNAQLHFQEFRGDSEAHLLSWLKRILLNRIANAGRFHHAQVRDQSRERAMETAGSAISARFETRDDNMRTPLSQEVALEESLQLQQAMSYLPADMREILRLRYVEGLSFAKLGDRLGLPEETARRHWAQAIVELQQRLRGSE